MWEREGARRTRTVGGRRDEESLIGQQRHLRSDTVLMCVWAGVFCARVRAFAVATAHLAAYHSKRAELIKPRSEGKA